MKRINSILVVTAMLVTVALTMLPADSRTQNTNRQVQNANGSARSSNAAEPKSTPLKGTMLVKRLPTGAEGVELKDGALRLKPGYKFEQVDGSSATVARMNGGPLGVTTGTFVCGCPILFGNGGSCSLSINSGAISCTNETCISCVLNIKIGTKRTEIMKY